MLFASVKTPFASVPVPDQGVPVHVVFWKNW